jgi:hypothetical protein
MYHPEFWWNQNSGFFIHFTEHTAKRKHLGKIFDL